MASTEGHPYSNTVLQAVSDYEDRNIQLENLDSMNDMSSFGRYRNQDRIAFRSGKPSTLPVPRFPMLVVLAPASYAPSGAFSLSRLFSRSGSLSVVGVASLRREDINPATVAQFLTTSAYAYGNGRSYDVSSPENALFRYDHPHEPGV